MSVSTDTEAPGRPDAARLARRVAAVALVVATALLFRPYFGLFGDARIYVGRAIATLDPGGVGRDLMFVQDRQSAFSVFPAALTAVVGLLGFSTAAWATALGALAVWTAAAAAAVSAFAGRRAALLSLLCVLILPSAYGGFAFGVGEAAPLPRPFAEALVLLALWALLRGRRVAALLLTAAAAAVHPIMALPGLGVVYLSLCLEDRRWLALAAAGAVVGLAGVALRLPLLDRLLVAMDGRWLAILHNCSPFLFLRSWPSDAWSQVAMRAATLGLAAALLDGRARRLAIAVLGVAALALAAASLLGDGLSSVLVLQAQPWRGLWPLSFLSSAALPIVAVRLWERGAMGRLAVGALGCAWITALLVPISVGASVAAVALFLVGRRRTDLSGPLQLLGWSLVALAAALAATGQAMALFHVTWGGPEPLRQPLPLDLVPDVSRVVVGALAVAAYMAWERRPAHTRPVERAVATGAAVALTLLLLTAATGWRAADTGRRLLESEAAAREVRAITAAGPGEVQWIGGDLEPVTLAGRPNWWTEVQAASSVFSREQAMIWAARRQRLVDSGVGPPVLLTPFPHDHPALFWTPSPDAVRGFCAHPDAPAWIVEPLRAGAGAPAGATLWRAPVAVGRKAGPRGPDELVADYAFLPCRALVEARRPGAQPVQRAR